MVSKKSKKDGSSINSRLALVIKSGKYNLGYRIVRKKLNLFKKICRVTTIKPEIFFKFDS